MAQQRGMKRAAKVLKRKQKTTRLKHDANIRRELRGPVARIEENAHDHEHDHEHEHEHEEDENKTKKKSGKSKEE